MDEAFVFLFLLSSFFVFFARGWMDGWMPLNGGQGWEEREECCWLSPASHNPQGLLLDTMLARISARDITVRRCGLFFPGLKWLTKLTGSLFRLG